MTAETDLADALRRIAVLERAVSELVEYLELEYDPDDDQGDVVYIAGEQRAVEDVAPL